MAKHWPIFALGSLLCLLGCVSWFALRRRSSPSFSTSSEPTAEALAELKSVARRVSSEWEADRAAIVSILGRLNRAQRKQKDVQPDDDATVPVDEGGSAPDQAEVEQSKLNQALARRYYGR